MHVPILTRAEGEALYSFERKHIVQLYSESGDYREWLVGADHQDWCIVHEGDSWYGTWTLLRHDPATRQWCEVPDMDVETFMAKHQLILAA